MDKIFLLNLENTSKTRFLKILSEELRNNFGETVDQNYNGDSRWSLLNLLEDDKLDSYQLIYINNDFWSGSGGIIRRRGDKKIYQAGARSFANTKAITRGLGSLSYTHKYNTKYQIERAKQLNCNEVVLSFNLHNERLFQVTRDYHLPKIFGKGVWKASDEPYTFNGVQQWLLTMSLE